MRERCGAVLFWFSGFWDLGSRLCCLLVLVLGLRGRLFICLLIDLIELVDLIDVNDGCE